MTRTEYLLARLSIWFRHVSFRVLVHVINLVPAWLNRPVGMPLADLAGRIAGRDIRFILEHGTVQEIKQVGDALSRHQDQRVAEAGEFVQRNAEKYVLLRVFRRWISR